MKYELWVTFDTGERVCVKGPVDACWLPTMEREQRNMRANGWLADIVPVEDSPLK